MRILFAITHLGFLRNFESTLALLAERGHTIHLVSDRAAQDGVTDGRPIVERLAARFRVRSRRRRFAPRSRIRGTRCRPRCAKG
jgi:hypothetical protein